MRLNHLGRVDRRVRYRCVKSRLVDGLAQDHDDVRSTKHLSMWYRGSEEATYHKPRAER
jgi:hypothetical protein